MDGNWGDWSHWDTCSSSCNGGTQSRIRFCDTPLPLFGGSNCTSNPGGLLSVTETGVLKENHIQTCNNTGCPSTTQQPSLPPAGKLILTRA